MERRASGVRSPQRAQAAVPASRPDWPVAGTVVMRVANADVLPHEFGALAETARGYIGELKALREEVAGRITEVNRQVDDGVLAATQDPKRPERLPAKEAPAPFLNFAPLDNAAESLTRAATRFERAQGTALGATMDRATAVAVNGMLKDVERTLTSDQGLPRRPWYRHILYAPGYYTGYGVKTMPAAREAIEQKQWVEAERELARVAAALEGAAAQITRIAERLEGGR